MLKAAWKLFVFVTARIIPAPLRLRIRRILDLDPVQRRFLCDPVDRFLALGHKFIEPEETIAGRTPNPINLTGRRCAPKYMLVQTQSA